MATKHRTVLFYSSLLKMSAIFGGMVLFGLYFDISTHQTNVSGEGCNPEDYEKTFQKVVVWETVTLFLFFISFVIGGGNILYVRLKEAAEQGVDVDVDGKRTLSFSKADVVAVVLTQLAYFCLIVVGFLMGDYRIARVHCG